MPENLPILIDTPAALEAQCLIWVQRPWLAVDTEFVRVDTYYPKLCLIQVGDGETACCVDTVALKDLTPLLDVLYQSQILKLFHAAGQDLEIFVQLKGACPAPMFDTQIAATLLGLGDQIGYAGLIEKMLGLSVDKSLSRTDWSRRPLTAPELAYAADDVRHLATIYAALHEQLAACGRLAWLAEDCARQCDPARYRTEAADAWQRLKGLPRLTPAQQRVAAALAQWRETTAQTRDRPRKWIIDDDAIYRLAERQPQSLTQMQELGVLPPKTLERHGELLLEVIKAAPQSQGAALIGSDELDAPRKLVLQKLQNALREIAVAAGVPASYLAPRADLIELIFKRERADIPLLQGWRRDVAGQKILALL